MENNELKSLYEYLKTKDIELEKELAPYYEKLEERENSRMNTYGIATFKDSSLLSERVSVRNLMTRINISENIEELIKKINEEISESVDKTKVFELQRQLRFIDEYLSKKKVSEQDFVSDIKKQNL